jgi:hypothetical protein
MGFIEDPVTLPTKSDKSPVPGGEDPDEWFAAADYNQIRQALIDIRTAIIALRSDCLAKGGTASLFSGISTATFDGTNENAFAGFASSDISQITVTSTTVLNGISNGAAGRLVILMHVGSANSIVVTNQSLAASAADRIITPAGNVQFIMGPGSGAIFRYDGTLSRWTILSRI